MTELRIWTTRNTTRIAAPPKRVFELVAAVDRWPELFGPLFEVERLGFEGIRERVRLRRRSQYGVRTWTSVREVDPVRMRVRFRDVDAPAPLTSMGGLWVLSAKGTSSVLALNHYFRVAGDDADAAARAERELVANSAVLLTKLRETAEFTGSMAHLIVSCSDTLVAKGKAAS